MRKIYETNEYKGYGKQNYYWYKYVLDGDTVIKYKCHRFKHFDGDESNWEYDENEETSWNVDSSSLPDWIRNYL